MQARLGGVPEIARDQVKVQLGIHRRQLALQNIKRVLDVFDFAFRAAPRLSKILLTAPTNSHANLRSNSEAKSRFSFSCLSAVRRVWATACVTISTLISFGRFALSCARADGDSFCKASGE